MGGMKGAAFLGPWHAALYSPHQPVPRLTAPLIAAVDNGTSLAAPEEDAQCNVSHKINEVACPPKCRFLKPAGERQFCNFTCVDVCNEIGRHLTWPDSKSGVCKRCPVPGCRVCLKGSTEEIACHECYMNWFYIFSPSAKRCVLKYWKLLCAFLSILAIPVLIGIMWFASLHCRPIINDDVKARSVIHSDRLKLRDHTRHSHNWYPLLTNLWKPDERGNAVGGLGLTLHFRFQLATLAWSLMALGAWLVTAFFYPRLLGLGSGRGVSLVLDPMQVYHICNVTDDKRIKAQMERVEGEQAMLVYTSALYVFTTIGALTFAFYQRSFYARWAANVTTMQDYTLFLSGFPEEAGLDVEEERAVFVREACGRTPVGVSVCWDFEDYMTEVTSLMRLETTYRQRTQSRDSIQRADLLQAKGARVRIVPAADSFQLADMEPPSRRCGGHCQRLLRAVRERLSRIDTLFLPGNPQISSVELESKAMNVLAEVNSTQHSCVVFETVEDCREARERFSLGGPATQFRGRHPVWASGMERDTQPDTVLWCYLGTEKAYRMWRVALSIFKIVAAIGLWAVCLYLPWGYYVALHMETYGQLPSVLAEMLFTMGVVGGNQAIYFLCNKAARSVAYIHTGEQEGLYMLLYMMAILVNMSVDLFVIRWTSVKAFDQFDMMIPNESLRHFMSYRLWKYNFPSCFLVPFMAEPIFLYILPFDLATRLIGTRDMGQAEADEILQPSPMDLSRYQDILLNLTQAVCALFLEPKYVLKTLVGLIIGQLFILIWDHFKVLRVVRAFNFSSFYSERVAARLTALPCGLLAACVCYRFLHLMSLGDLSDLAEADMAIFLKNENSVWAFVVLVLHVGLHLYLLHRTSPQSKTDASQRVRFEKPSYKEMATERPANYFNTNPVHCLRSRYLHRDNPPCNFYILGKEHLLEANPSIGQHYHAKRWDDKRKTFALEMSFVTQTFRRSMRQSAVVASPSLVLGSSGTVVASGRLWKMCHAPMEAFVAEHHWDFPPNLPHPPGKKGVRRKTQPRASLDGGQPWKSLGGWRLRLFTLRDEGEGCGELTYCSEKTEQNITACTLERNDPTMRLQLFPSIHLDPPSADVEEGARLALQSYELAFMQGKATGKARIADLPKVLHPLAISWVELGVERHLVLAHEREEKIHEWLRDLRSFSR